MFFIFVAKGREPEKRVARRGVKDTEVLCSHQSFDTRLGVFYFCGKGARTREEGCEARRRQPAKYFAKPKVLTPSVRAVFIFMIML